MFPCYINCVDISFRDSAVSKGKGRPGGNPELEKYQFQQKYDWGESCTERIAVRLPPTLNRELKKVENWQEFTRQAIAKALEEMEN